MNGLEGKGEGEAMALYVTSIRRQVSSEPRSIETRDSLAYGLGLGVTVNVSCHLTVYARTRRNLAVNARFNLLEGVVDGTV
jgi:hypothetical protein